MPLLKRKSSSEKRKQDKRRKRAKVMNYIYFKVTKSFIHLWKNFLYSYSMECFKSVNLQCHVNYTIILHQNFLQIFVLYIKTVYDNTQLQWHFLMVLSKLVFYQQDTHLVQFNWTQIRIYPVSINRKLMFVYTICPDRRDAWQLSILQIPIQIILLGPQNVL